ncbi:MAG: glutaredoxin domain-containing protein [Eubacteriales bacterium]
MLKIIGSLGCSNCEVTKMKLKNKGIDFEYILLNELSSAEQEEVLNRAKEENVNSLPILIKNKKIVKVRDVV